MEPRCALLRFTKVPRAEGFYKRRKTQEWIRQSPPKMHFLSSKRPSACVTAVCPSVCFLTFYLIWPPPSSPPPNKQPELREDSTSHLLDSTIGFLTSGDTLYPCKAPGMKMSRNANWTNTTHNPSSHTRRNNSLPPVPGFFRGVRPQTDSASPPPDPSSHWGIISLSTTSPKAPDSSRAPNPPKAENHSF